MFFFIELKAGLPLMEWMSRKSPPEPKYSPVHSVSPPAPAPSYCAEYSPRNPVVYKKSMRERERERRKEREKG